jgi:hypothetical protein
MYTYAFCKISSTSLILPEGIANSIQVVGNGELSALVEPALDLEAIQAEDDRLLQAVLIHDRVLRTFFQQTTILPLRFGTQFVSLEGLQQHLQAHQTQYLAKLTQLTGKAEYTLKLNPTENSDSLISPNATGKQYFLAKKQHYQNQLAQQQQQQVEFQQMLHTIAQLYPDFVLVEPSDGTKRVYLLGDRQKETELQQQLHDWQTLCPHWDLQLGEALPPYHFV